MVVSKLSPNLTCHSIKLTIPLELSCQLAYPSQYGVSLPAQPDWVEDLIMEDGFKQLILVVGLKGRLASHHLVHQHTQRPPINTSSIILLLQDLKKNKQRIRINQLLARSLKSDTFQYLRNSREGKSIHERTNLNISGKWATYIRWLFCFFALPLPSQKL